MADSGAGPSELGPPPALWSLINHLEEDEAALLLEVISMPKTPDQIHLSATLLHDEAACRDVLAQLERAAGAIEHFL